MHALGFVGLILLLCGLVLLVVSLVLRSRSQGRAAAARAWPEADAVVTLVDIPELRPQGALSTALDVAALVTLTPTRRYRNYTPVVRYRYQVGGRTFDGHRLRFGHVGASTPYGARQMLAPFAVGQHIRIRFNPYQPEESVIEPVASRAGYLPALIAGPVLIALGLIFLIGDITGLIHDNGGGGGRSSYRRHRY